jgi:hypothetical protein
VKNDATYNAETLYPEVITKCIITVLKLNIQVLSIPILNFIKEDKMKQSDF